MASRDNLSILWILLCFLVMQFIFQPAEEAGVGARAMCDDGALTSSPPVDEIVRRSIQVWISSQQHHLLLLSGTENVLYCTKLRSCETKSDSDPNFQNHQYTIATLPLQRLSEKVVRAMRTYDAIPYVGPHRQCAYHQFGPQYRSETMSWPRSFYKTTSARVDRKAYQRDNQKRSVWKMADTVDTHHIS